MRDRRPTGYDLRTRDRLDDWEADQEAQFAAWADAEWSDEGRKYPMMGVVMLVLAVACLIGLVALSWGLLS